MGEIAKKTISGVKWTAIESISIQLFQFIVGILIARVLTPSEYGLVGMIGIFLGVASAFVDSGMTNALIRQKESTEEDFSTVFFFNLMVSCACYGILYFGAPLIAKFFHQPELILIVRVISLNLVIGALGSTQGAKFTKDLDFKTLAKISTTSSFLSGIAGIIMAYSGCGVWTLVFMSMISSVISVVLKYVFSKWKPQLIFSKKSFRELFGFGSKLLGSNILHIIYLNLTTLLIGKFYSAKQLGFYSRGQGIPSTIDSTILSVLNRVTFPILAKYQDDKELLGYVYRKYIRSTSLPIYFLLILVAALSKPLILFLLTDKWIQAVPYMQIFCFIYLSDNVSSLNLNLLQVLGRSDLFLRLEIIKKIVSTALLIASVPFGVMAICAVKLLYSFLAIVINTYYTRKLLNWGFISQFKDFSPYILYSLLSCLPAYILTFSGLPHILILLLGFSVAAVLYASILYCRKDAIYMEYLVQKAFPKLKSIVRKSVHSVLSR